MSNDEFKGVMIGAGYFAQHHAEAWQRVHGARLTAVADVMAERAESFAARWQIERAYTDIEQMLERERPDFVDIVVGPEHHLPLVTLAAKRGLHVICQKPMAPTWDDCLAMIRVCEAHKVRLMIHENWRWQAWFREIRRMLDADEFGALRYAGFVMRNGDGWGDAPYPQQPYIRSMKRMLIEEMVVHFLDTLRFLAGEIASVYCQTRQFNSRINGEDCALIQLRFDSDAIGVIDANRYTGRPSPAGTLGDFTLEGARAKIRATPTGQLFFTEYGREEVAHEYALPIQGYKGDSVKAAQQHFIACLHSDAHSESEGNEYLKTVAAVLACYHSAETGQVVLPESV